MTPYKLSSGVLNLERAMHISRIISCIKQTEITKLKLWKAYLKKCQSENVKPVSHDTYERYMRIARETGEVTAELKMGEGNGHKRMHYRKVVKVMEPVQVTA